MGFFGGSGGKQKVPNSRKKKEAQSKKDNNNKKSGSSNSRSSNNNTRTSATTASTSRSIISPSSLAPMQDKTKAVIQQPPTTKTKQAPIQLSTNNVPPKTHTEDPSNKKSATTTATSQQQQQQYKRSVAQQKVASIATPRTNAASESTSSGSTTKKMTVAERAKAMNARSTSPRTTAAPRPPPTRMVKPKAATAAIATTTTTRGATAPVVVARQSKKSTTVPPSSSSSPSSSIMSSSIAITSTTPSPVAPQSKSAIPPSIPKSSTTKSSKFRLPFGKKKKKEKTTTTTKKKETTTTAIVQQESVVPTTRKKGDSQPLPTVPDKGSDATKTAIPVTIQSISSAAQPKESAPVAPKKATIGSTSTSTKTSTSTSTKTTTASPPAIASVATKEPGQLKNTTVAAASTNKPGKINMNKFATLNIPGMGVGSGGGGPIDTNANIVQPGKHPPMKNIFASARRLQDPASQGQAGMSEQARQTILAPTKSTDEDDENEDWTYLYELATQYDKYKAEEVEATKKLSRKNNNTTSSSNSTRNESSAPPVPGDTKAIKNNLNNLFGGGGGRGGVNVMNMTANGSFLNQKYFDKYLTSCASGVALEFSNETGLFKRFRTRDEQRSISQQFATALLQHPKSNHITQLNMNNSLLPDSFLIALCNTCVSHDGLQHLQVLNLESNELGREGIEALSKIIANSKIWTRLQIVKLENQKKSIAAGAEEFLGDAVVTSPSLVQVGLRMKGGIPKQQVANTVQVNMDKLRIARRRHASKQGTLKARKRNEMEILFDTIASNKDKNIKEVDLTENLRFLGLNATERTKSGGAFATNTSVTKITMTKLKLDDDFAIAFGKALEKNTTLDSVVFDSNSFSGKGVLAVLTGLGKNTSITSFQIRHQSKTMASSDEEVLPDLLKDNTTLLKLGTDVRNPLIKTKIERKMNENREFQRKQRVSAQKKK